MSPMSGRLREFQCLDYVDPKPFLVRLRRMEREIAHSDLSREVRTLRTNQLKSWREAREGALFAYALGLRLGEVVLGAKGEDQNRDYDCVTLRNTEEKSGYGPVQIKEVVPEYLNRETCIQDIVDSLQR